jgi:hypothetical protein
VTVGDGNAFLVANAEADDEVIDRCQAPDAPEPTARFRTSPNRATTWWA